MCERVKRIKRDLPPTYQIYPLSTYLSTCLREHPLGAIKKTCNISDITKETYIPAYLPTYHLPTYLPTLKNAFREQSLRLLVMTFQTVDQGVLNKDKYILLGHLKVVCPVEFVLRPLS